MGDARSARMAPTGPLAGAVERFDAYEAASAKPLRRRELPDGRAVLVVNLRDDLCVAHPGGETRRFAQGRGFFSGASSTYAVTVTAGAQAGAQIKFTLLGARLFLGAPLAEFGDALVDGSDALGRDGADLAARLAEAPSPAARVRLLAETAARRIGASEPIRPELAFAFRRLDRADARIGDVAREIGYRRERLAAAFRREFGLSPKLFARIRRFARTLRLREASPGIAAAALAAEGGYVDQAHMTHEFQAFAGAAPAALWRRRLAGGGFAD